MPTPSVYSACDKDRVCHEAIRSHRPETRPEHLFKNLNDYITEEASQQMDEIYEEVMIEVGVVMSTLESLGKEKEKQMLTEYGNTLLDRYMRLLTNPDSEPFRNRAPCVMHPDLRDGCPLPHTGILDSAGLLMGMAGTTCTDVSSFGLHPRTRSKLVGKRQHSLANIRPWRRPARPQCQIPEHLDGI